MTLLPSKYNAIHTDDVVCQCHHLTQQQQKNLAELLQHHQFLLSCELGPYLHEKIHLELNPDAEPQRTWAYTVTQAHFPLFKQDLEQIVQIGVFAIQNG